MSSRLPYIIVVIVLLAIGWFAFAGYQYLKVTNFHYTLSSDGEIIATTTPNSSPNTTVSTSAPAPAITSGEVIGSQLSPIASIVAVNDTKMIMGTLTGQIYLLSLDKQNLLIDDLNLRQVGDGGLISIVLETDFLKNGVYYAHYLYRDDSGETKAKVEKRQADLTGEMKTNRQLAIVQTSLPAGLSDNGVGLIKVKNQFWLLFGDLERAVLASDKSVFNGKIVKLNSLTGQLATDQIVSSGLRNPQTATVMDGDIYFVDATLPSLSRLFKLEPNINYGWPVEPNCQGGEATPLFCDGQAILALTSGEIQGKKQLVWSTSAGAINFFDLTDKKINNHLSTAYGRIGHLALVGDKLVAVTDNRGHGGGRPNDNQVVIFDLTNLK